MLLFYFGLTNIIIFILVYNNIMCWCNISYDKFCWHDNVMIMWLILTYMVKICLLDEIRCVFNQTQLDAWW